MEKKMDRHVDECNIYSCSKVGTNIERHFKGEQK